MTPEASFTNDLGAGEPDVVNLLGVIADKFDILIPEEDAAQLTTVGQVVDYVAARKA